MKIALTGGGSGGHVTPLLAVASEIKKNEPSAKIRYIGEVGKDNLNNLVKSSKDIEKSYYIHAGKLSRFHGKKPSWYLTQPKLLFKNLKDFFKFGLGLLEAVFIVIFWRPDVLFVKGGYVSLPIGLVSALFKVPIITHDSDAHPGLTNRILSKYASKIAVGWPVEYYPKYPQSKLNFCGVPVSDKFSNPIDQKDAKKAFNLDINKPVVSVTGGGLGAVRLNNAVLKNLRELTKKYAIIWVSGAHQYSELEAAITNVEGDIRLLSFTDRMDEVLIAADVVVTRAGATAMAEVAALKKPTIIVPNPLLTGGHQLKNAKVYEDNKAAIVAKEDNLKNNPALLFKDIEKIFNNQSLSKELSESIAKFAEPQATQKMARLILNVGSQ